MRPYRMADGSIAGELRLSQAEAKKIVLEAEALSKGRGSELDCLQEQNWLG